jgi:hypothetical protein
MSSHLAESWELINNQYKYEGMSPQYADNEKEGHAMLLVGVMRVGKDADLVDGTDLYLFFRIFGRTSSL